MLFKWVYARLCCFILLFLMCFGFFMETLCIFYVEGLMLKIQSYVHKMAVYLKNMGLLICW